MFELCIYVMKTILLIGVLVYFFIEHYIKDFYKDNVFFSFKDIFRTSKTYKEHTTLQKDISIKYLYNNFAICIIFHLK